MNCFCLQLDLVCMGKVNSCKVYEYFDIKEPLGSKYPATAGKCTFVLPVIPGQLGLKEAGMRHIARLGLPITPHLYSHCVVWQYLLANEGVGSEWRWDPLQ